MTVSENFHEAARHSCLPVGPEDIGVPEGRHRQRPPRTPVEDSYATQSYRLRWYGTDLLVHPGAPDGPGPRHPVHVLSAWHYRGVGATWDECRQLQYALRSRLRERRITRVVMIASDRSWFEEAVLVRGLTDDEAVRQAHFAGQAAVIRWHRNTMTVLPTDIVTAIPAVTFTVTARPAPPTCPVRDDDVDRAQCVMIGGPYGSRAIHTAALQSLHQAMAVALVGCRACDDGATHRTIGRHDPRGFSGRVLGSRHGGMYWRPGSPVAVVRGR